MLTALVALALLANSASAQTTPGVYRSYTLVKTDLTVNEPVLLKFSIENRLPDALTVRVGADRGGCCSFQAKITRPDGRAEVAAPAVPMDGGAVSFGSREIEPFSTYSTVLLANKWFDFDIPGRYILDVDNVSLLVDTTAPKSPYPTDGHLVIEIGPRDPGRLQRICADLEERLMNLDFATDAIEAEDALTHVIDPVAVPYIARLLQAKEGMTSILVEGLARIGDSVAVDALVLRLNSPWKDEDTPRSVRAALDKIEKKTNDPTIKLKIQASRR